MNYLLDLEYNVATIENIYFNKSWWNGVINTKEIRERNLFITLRKIWRNDGRGKKVETLSKEASQRREKMNHCVGNGKW